MSAATSRLPAERGPGLALGVVGLGLFGVVCGVGLAVGELQALVASLTVLACFAVLADFRIGAVLLLVMLPVEGSYLFPHSVFGVTGLNPLNLVLAATLFSYLIRGHGLKTFLPKPLAWLFVVPIAVAGLIGSRHVDEVYPYFYEVEVIHFTDALGYLRDLLLKPMLMVLAALVVAQAVMKSKKVESFLIPFVVAVWVMSVMAIGWVMVNVLFLVWKFNARTAGLALLACGIGLAFMPGAVIGRMSLGLVGGGDVNEFSAGRVEEIWIPLLPELFKSPIWGSGLDST